MQRGIVEFLELCEPGRLSRDDNAKLFIGRVIDAPQLDLGAPHPNVTNDEAEERAQLLERVGAGEDRRFG
jgi:hypothetical protein